MSVLKFQTSIINGKPQIHFEKERVAPPVYKFSKMNKDQRFPLRDKFSVHQNNETPQTQATPTPKPINPAHSKCLGDSNVHVQQPKKVAKVVPHPAPVKSIMKHGLGKKADGSVTLTQEQLSAILNSVTQAANAKSNVRISIDTKDNYVNIDAESPRHKKSQGRSSNLKQRFDVDSDSGDNNSDPPRKHGQERTQIRKTDSQSLKNAAKSKAKDSNKPKEESLFGLLEQAGSNESRHQSKKVRSKDTSISRRGESESTEARSPLEDLMQRVIHENKDKLTEDQLVDLLAEVYIEAKRRGLTTDVDSESLSREPDLRMNHQRHRDRSESRPSSACTSEDESRSRHRKTDINQRSGDDKDRSHRSQSQKSNDQLKRQAKQRVANDRTATSNKTLEVLTGSGDNAKNHVDRKAAAPPTPLSMVEKKKRQWEEERKEISKLQYDPWGRPGGGAPPVEHSVGAIELSPRGAEKWDSSQYNSLSPRDSQSKRPGSHNQESARIVPPIDHRGAESDGNLGSSFNRGRGLASLDAGARADMDRKKKKEMEHQEAIRQQVEEHKRMKALERERRIREEIEEEQRLAREREKMQRQYDDELGRQRKKEEEQNRRLAALKETMDAAEEAARLDKHRKRLARLDMGGHDTSNLRASLEAQITSRSVLNNPNAPYSQCSSPYLSQEGPDFGSEWATPRFRQPPDPIVSDFRSANSQLGGTFDLGRKQDNTMRSEFVQTEPSLIDTLHLENQRNNSFRSDSHIFSGTGISTREQDLHQHGKFHLHGISEDGPASYRHSGAVNFNQTYELDTTKRNNPRASNRPSRKTSYLEKTRQELKKKIQKPVNIHERPEWNAKNPEKKNIIKQSERDPYYAEKEKERQERRFAREAELMAKVQANADLIPSSNLIPTDRIHKKKHPPPPGGYLEIDTKRSQTRNRQRSYSPPSERQTTHDHRYGHSSAPPTPPYGTQRFEYGSEGYTNRDIPPLIRTTDVLNPALADQPLPNSREVSGRKRDTARRAYMKNLNPAQYGSYMENRDDRYGDSVMPARSTKDPIFNPGVVRDRPTPRQNVILQQLSDIRQGLLQRQKEIETSLSMTEGIA